MLMFACRLKYSAVNQLCMDAEKIFPVLRNENFQFFRQVLECRINDNMVLSKRKCISKIIKKIINLKFT